MSTTEDSQNNSPPALRASGLASARFKESKMNFGYHSHWLRATAVICTALLVPYDVRLIAQEPPAAPEAPKLKAPGELDSLVAPLALYPDPLLAQVLAASTYPLEIVQARI
jgi:uncharacterized protein DUF3300